MGLTVLIAAAVLFGLLLVWLVLVRPARKASRERHQGKPLKQADNCRISDKSLALLTHGFIDGEDTVYWADRQHVIVFWQTGGAALLAGCLLASLAVAAALHPLGYHYHLIVNGKQQEHYVDLGWVWALCSLLAGAALGWAGAQWLVWRAEYRVITNKHLLVITQPWAWAFWLWPTEDYDPQPLTSIVAAAPHGADAGRIFDYGTVKVKVPSMEAEDAALEIHYVRDHKEFAKKLDNLRAEARRQAGEPAR